MVILGLDPGLATTGYAVISRRPKKPAEILDCGIIETRKTQNLPQRLQAIGRDLEILLKKHRPRLAVVESLYFAKNAKTAINVAQARGVLLLTLERKKIKILEITPLAVKSRLTGYGRAPKEQIQRMAAKIFGLARVPKPDDVADALALAWCGMKN